MDAFRTLTPGLCRAVLECGGDAMPDVYATITEAPASVVETVGDAMELRATDAQQQRMLEDYVSRVEFPAAARVLEVGCGTGAISRYLITVDGVGEVVGVDPSPGLLERARLLATSTPGLSFEEADGRHLPFADASFDVVVAHTVVSHVPTPQLLVAEALRVLRDGGTAAFFDGDYSTMTVSSGDDDPLQACARAFASGFVNDPWVVRRLAAMLRSAGFSDLDFRSHGYAQITNPAYMLSVVDRGAAVLVAAGLIGEDLAAALRAEARRREKEGTFFGHIAYASLLGHKPSIS
jgi:ubiquinone/menaquinone biosynthesis C-methylase UbiE